MNRAFCGYTVTKQAFRSRTPVNRAFCGYNILTTDQVLAHNCVAKSSSIACTHPCNVCKKHRPQTMYTCTDQHIYIHARTDCKVCTKHRPVYVHNIHTDHVYKMYTQTMAGSHLHGTVCALCYHMKLFYPHVNTLLFLFFRPANVWIASLCTITIKRLQEDASFSL